MSLEKGFDAARGGSMIIVVIIPRNTAGRDQTYLHVYRKDFGHEHGVYGAGHRS